MTNAFAKMDHVIQMMASAHVLMVILEAIVTISAIAMVTNLVINQLVLALKGVQMVIMDWIVREFADVITVVFSTKLIRSLAPEKLLGYFLHEMIDCTAQRSFTKLLA